MSDFAEKARTVGVSLRRGGAKVTTVRRDDDGSVAGKLREHWDDHVDAKATPRTVRVKAMKQEG